MRSTSSIALPKRAAVMTKMAVTAAVARPISWSCRIGNAPLLTSNQFLPVLVPLTHTARLAFHFTILFPLMMPVCEAYNNRFARHCQLQVWVACGKWALLWVQAVRSLGCQQQHAPEGCSGLWTVDRDGKELVAWSQPRRQVLPVSAKLDNVSKMWCENTFEH